LLRGAAPPASWGRPKAARRACRVIRVFQSSDRGGARGPDSWGHAASASRVPKPDGGGGGLANRAGASRAAKSLMRGLAESPRHRREIAATAAWRASHATTLARGRRRRPALAAVSPHPASSPAGGSPSSARRQRLRRRTRRLAEAGPCRGSCLSFAPVRIVDLATFPKERGIPRGRCSAFREKCGGTGVTGVEPAVGRLVGGGGFPRV